jgi:hypothetical protein
MLSLRNGAAKVGRSKKKPPLLFSGATLLAEERT